jgi:NAD(P)-dependent dehydrogenase (short-subunit alcohol dehydrogenase family)
MSNVTFDFRGQVAIVTGGGTGIGYSIATELAKAGADVVVASRNLSHLEKAAHEIGRIGRRSLAVSVDVRNPEDIEKMISSALEKFGSIDILINNAGASFRAACENISLNGWNAIVGINLTGVFLCCQAAAKVFIPKKKGKIVNISSVYGVNEAPSMAHYGAAKAGVNNLTKSLAHEWAKYNININCIAPGLIETENMKQVWNITDEVSSTQRISSTPLGRLGRPEEIAYAVLFLSSEASNYITGQTICVDGGGWRE